MNHHRSIVFMVMLLSFYPFACERKPGAVPSQRSETEIRQAFESLLDRVQSMEEFESRFRSSFPSVQKPRRSGNNGLIIQGEKVVQYSFPLEAGVTPFSGVVYLSPDEKVVLGGWFSVND